MGIQKQTIQGIPLVILNHLGFKVGIYVDLVFYVVSSLKRRSTVNKLRFWSQA